MEAVLNSTKFSIKSSYANMARQLDLCDIADGAREIGAIPATYNPYDSDTWDMSIADMYGTELAPSVVVLGELRISALDMASAYATFAAERSEEHTSELQSRGHLVCRLLLEKK